MYQFSVSEGVAVGTPVGRIIATDADMGENTDMSYLIKEGGELFKVTTDVETQEAVVSIKKVRLTQRNAVLLSSIMPTLFSFFYQYRGKKIIAIHWILAYIIYPLFIANTIFGDSVFLNSTASHQQAFFKLFSTCATNVQTQFWMHPYYKLESRGGYFEGDS